MSVSAPAFQFYPQDFLVGTGDMTAEEVGGYIRLLCYSWAKGEIPSNPKKLMQMSGVFEAESLNVVIKKFVKTESGGLVNVKLETIRAEQQEYREKQRVKANKRWDKKTDAVGYATALPMDMPEACPSPSPSPSTIPTPSPSKKTNNIELRKKNFSATLSPFLDSYGKELLNDFYKYWTEPNKSGTKFKQELERTWSLSRRLETWAKNDKQFNSKQNGKITNTSESRMAAIEQWGNE